VALVASELCENGSAVSRHSSSELRRLGCVCAADRAVLVRGPLWLSDVCEPRAPFAALPIAAGVVRFEGLLM
jgi:hypothetical protein